MTKAAAAFLDECSALLCDKPYCVLGHSLGAWLAYEVCAQAQARGLPLPRKLYASANRAPHLHHLKHDVDPTPFSRLPKERFWKAWDRRYGHIPGLDSEHGANAHACSRARALGNAGRAALAAPRPCGVAYHC